jgi:hypothetical protein
MTFPITQRLARGGCVGGPPCLSWGMTGTGDPPHALRELSESSMLQLEASQAIQWPLPPLPDDYLPVARCWPGYATLATIARGMRRRAEA